MVAQSIWAKAYYTLQGIVQKWKCTHPRAAFVLSRYLLMDWSGVDYCDAFISCLDSGSDGTHSLQSIHCISPNLTKKQTHLHLRLAWRLFLLAKFILGWNIPFLDSEHSNISPPNYQLSGIRFFFCILQVSTCMFTLVQKETKVHIFQKVLFIVCKDKLWMNPWIWWLVGRKILTQILLQAFS